MSVQTEITRIESAKTAIATAIEGKGVTVPEGTKIDGIAPLIESIEAGGVGVQPDWNQNDSTQPDYIKNRPFYTGNPVETVLVEESTVTFAENHGLYVTEFPSTFEATVGETYKVSWDGTTYECACVDFNNSPLIGNLSIMGVGSDTGEPFVIGVNNGVGIQIGTADASASHTVSISGFAPEVVKIEEKYLPEHKYISYEEQELTDSQKEIARNNINAVDNSIFIEIPTNVISASDFDIYYEKYKKTGLPIKWEGAFINYIFHSGTIEGIKTYELVSGNQLFLMTEYIYNGQKKVSHGSWQVAPKKTYAYQISMTNPYNPSIRKTLELNDGGKIVTNDGYEIMMWNGGVVVNSSTPGSTKKFKITVDDSGTLTATEVS